MGWYYLENIQKEEIPVFKYITILSVLSCLGVLFLHMNGIFWTFSKDATWISANIIESVFYFSAPMFLMISGATLLDYRDRYDTKTFFKKRVSKVLIPYILWTFIALFTYTLMGRFSWHDFFSNFVFEGLLYTKVESTYYFFLILLAIYLAIPFVTMIPNEKRQKAFKYIIIVILIVEYISPFILRHLFHRPYNGDWSIPVISRFMIYPVIGYYIHKYEIKNKAAIYLMGILGFLLIFGGTWIFSYEAESVDRRFKEYLNLPCLCYTSAIFLLFKNLDKTKFIEKLHIVFKLFAPFTFGIYLMHKIVISILEKYSKLDFSLIWVRLTFPVLVFFALSGILFLIKKVPYLKKIVP